MKMLDITKKLTEYVGKYISEGYIISNTMSGHQGEINKVDLVKGEELIRIWLNSDRSTWSDCKDAWHGDTVVLRVSRWKHPVNYKYDNMPTVWNSDLEDIVCLTFYHICGEDWYYDNLEEALNYQRVHESRYQRIRFSYIDLIDVTSPKTQQIAAKYLKRKVGYQRVNAEKITIKKRQDYTGKIDYRISYGSRSYIIQ